MRRPFLFFEVALMVAFLVGLLVGVTGRSVVGCGAAVPPIATDVVTIEARDAACIIAHLGEPDEAIIADCSPGGDPSSPKAQAIAVTLTICHAEGSVPVRVPDAGGGG